MTMKRNKSYSAKLACLLATGFAIAGLALAIRPVRALGQATQSSSSSAQSPAAPAGGAAKTDSLPIPVDEIIRKFAQHESDFKLARDNYTYSQEVLVEDVAPTPGEYRLESEIVFTPQGRRYEQITYAPQPSLHDFTLSPEDMKDLENIQPFVLNAEDLPKYDVEFSNQEKLDELNTYVFM